ncbi:hypothetical protein AVEN_154409-1 [Araneus ventricosus]|uniref:Uncharacterized protein n=1 Tax=Araneus ventricosus TaxID=182803 RepID=A0A4Y2KGY8_ARAVE|nr:hypothetical protein AVEN_154409-1 [Araneus ventricosus]
MAAPARSEIPNRSNVLTAAKTFTGSPVCTQPAQLLSWHQTRGREAVFCHYRCDCREESMKYHFRLMEAWEDKALDRKKMGLPTALVV